MSRAIKITKEANKLSSGGVILAYGSKEFNGMQDETQCDCEGVFGMTPKEVSEAISGLQTDTAVAANEMKHINEKIDGISKSVKEGFESIGKEMKTMQSYIDRDKGKNLATAAFIGFFTSMLLSVFGSMIGIFIK